MQIVNVDNHSSIILCLAKIKRDYYGMKLRGIFIIVVVGI